jgi:fumarylacetoacetate (FAA) hydrolase
MKLASLDDGSRDGQLVVVNRAGTRYVPAGAIAPTLQSALDDWQRCAPRLRELAASLQSAERDGAEVVRARWLAPLPRAYEWVDGSAYLNHLILVRRARGAEPPATLETDPLVYQGGSGVLLGPYAPFPLPNPDWGLDFEAEVAVVLGDVPRGLGAQAAESSIRLLLLANDWSYRNLIPTEIAKGFGFFNSKPATAFSPFAVTKDELGEHWRAGRLHLPLLCTLNGQRVGEPNAGVGMHFSFHDLIAHIARTRAFTAGTILGGGTVSNSDEHVGVACLAERRSREMLARGAAQTPFLAVGDSIRIEMLDERGQSIFGTIEQEVTAP